MVEISYIVNYSDIFKGKVIRRTLSVIAEYDESKKPANMSSEDYKNLIKKHIKEDNAKNYPNSNTIFSLDTYLQSDQDV